MDVSKRCYEKKKQQKTVQIIIASFFKRRGKKEKQEPQKEGLPEWESRRREELKLKSK